MKVSLKLVGNYMCKNPPAILIDVNNESNNQQSQKYLFNTPADIQRNFQAQYTPINGDQVIMFTKFSHDTMAGLVNLILSQFHRKYNMIKFRLYGTKQQYDYFQTAKFHIGNKVFGISYCCLCRKNSFRLGILDPQLYDKYVKSDRYPQFVRSINWVLQKQDQSKINDCTKYLKEHGTYYEDSNIIIKYFYEISPFKTYGKNIQFYNSVTNFLCIYKNNNQKGQVNEGSNDQTDSSQNKNAHKASLIMTYRSVEQIKNILSGNDAIQNLNDGFGLLEYISRRNSTNKYKQGGIVQKKKVFSVNSVIHILQDPQLIYSTQFYQLFKAIDQICQSSQIKEANGNQKISIKVNHLFYGYGIKSETTNIHYLINSYYRSNRFYSICSKFLKYLPNITLNQFSYWAKIYQNDFVDIPMKMKKLNLSKSNIQVYKPIHQLQIINEFYQKLKKQNKQTLSNINPYRIQQSWQKSLEYPLFSNSLTFNPKQQFMNFVYKRSKMLGYNKSLKKGIISKRQKQFKQFDPRIIFLGTNSKFPSELRNVSGILIEIDSPQDQTLFLLDCGAGTYQQFVDHYTPEELDRKLIQLKVIFMTHLHADHNLGVLDLISKRNKILKLKYGSIKDKIFLIFPSNMLSWIHHYCESLQNILEGCQILFNQTLSNQKIQIYDFQFQKKRQNLNIENSKISQSQLFKNTASNKNQTSIKNQDFCAKYLKRDGGFQEYSKNFGQMDNSKFAFLLEKYNSLQSIIKEQFLLFLKKLKLKRFEPSKVVHCPQSYGVIIQHENGLKVSYSGDCRPTPEFLNQAKNSTLLIHQATFETPHIQRAIQRFHSTFHEALQAGYSSKSSNICLTHFTGGPFDRDRAQNQHQALYKPQILEYYKKNGIVACDHLQFKLSEMDEAGKVSKIISSLGTNQIMQKIANPLASKTKYYGDKIDLLN